MSLQDGMLTFRIKETIFLSADKAGIGELKELELLPDVEIIENTQDISITGCLHLQGKYLVAKEGQETEDEGDSLLTAMKFPPFHLETGSELPFLYDAEQELTHRIPLNITIPLSRVAEVGEIFAVVDGLDYELKANNQLQIEAELKLTGITLIEPEAARAAEEEWEFVHVANEDDERGEQDVPTSSLEEIEEKLEALERAVEAHEEWQTEPIQPPPPPFLPVWEKLNRIESSDIRPVFGGYSQADSDEPEEQEGGASREAQATASAAGGSVGDADEELAYDVSGDQSEAEPTTAREEEPAIEVLAENAAEFAVQEMNEEETVQQEAAEAAVIAEADAEEVSTEEVSAEETMTQPDAPQEAELRVAISGKPARESGEELNLTSIFTQSKRQSAPSPEATEQVFQSDVQDSETASSTLAAVGSLSSFVREEEQPFSRLKMCIIQREETLQSISERYSVPISRLMEANSLESDRITEGQVLYIPQ
ncbi:LysM peptidoglycan-binding domain-containing protein [Brevibacillus sp. B_LB10_24]|uniref:LysM peptidoglycan-binding domain-containing protein n=1 Tax=Brevibacillus sp. B_LB10_24 TaxID=3380645 RepID=UPI0038B6F512